MSGLPKGWVESTVDEVGDISSGFGFPDRFQGNVAGELPFAKVRDISQAYQQNGGILSSAGNYVSRADLTPLKARTVPAGSVAFAKIGEALKLNRRVLLDVEAVLDNNCMAVTPHQGLVEPKFLYRFLTTLDFAPFSVATTVPSIRKGDVGSIRLPLPPLAEQKRILAKLDALNAKSAHARTELARIETLVSRYKLALLSKAFSGELTASFERGNSAARLDTDSEVTQLWSIPETWSWCRTDQIGRVGLGRQRSPKNHEGPQMRPYLRSANITWAGVDTIDVKEMNFDDADFKRFKLEVGDVLLNEGSGSAKEVGKPAIWRGEIADCCYQNTLLRVQPHRCSSEYVYYYFLLTARAGRFVSSTQGVNIQHIGREGLACYPFSLAPEPEQHEIVRRIESAFAKIDRLAKEAKRALELVGRLDEAILAKAFRGELVPQDKNDEPAEHLLARIRAERAAAPKEKARTVKRKTTMLTARDFLKTKLENWPADGVSFQDLRREFGGSYDDLKEAVFASVSDEKSALQQIFDEKTSMMTIRKRGR